MDLENIMNKIKEQGYKLTPQRMLVVRLLARLRHPTAEEIYSIMTKEFPYVSQATVYNTLKMLKQIGVVNELTYSNRQSHFEVAMKEHWHFNCDICGGIFDLEEAEKGYLPVLPDMREGFQVNRYRIELYGTCKDCAADPS